MDRYYREVWGQNDQSAADELLAPGYRDNTPPRGSSPDRAGHRNTVAALHAAFPNLELKVEDLIAEGDRVVGRWTLRGSHQGDFFGIPPTGALVTLTGIDIARFERGRIVEIWHLEDLLGLFQQMRELPHHVDADAD
jgi:predicted ester cyclase